MLPVRKCGSLGFKCAAQGLGCNAMGVFYNGVDGEATMTEAERFFERASEVGDLMIDTSDIYGRQTSELVIGSPTFAWKTTQWRLGRAIANKERFKIATKCGLIPTSQGRALADSSPEHIKKACQGLPVFCFLYCTRVRTASLDRLGVDCIDLYYLHRYDRKTPIEDTMRAFKELVEEGKIKYVGVSEISAATLRKAHAVCPITAYQMEWCVFTRNVEEELVPTCRELGIGIVAYSPLGRGFLTGSIKSIDDIPIGDKRRAFPRFSKDNLADNLEIVNIIESIAVERGCTPGQVALAWVHAQGEDVFPIPGTKHVHRFEENIGAFHVKLTDEDMHKLGEIAGRTKGERCSKTYMSWESEEKSMIGD